MDVTRNKVSSGNETRGDDGQYRLASGESVGLRMWRDEEPAVPKATSSRPYETVGYVLGGRAELHIADAVILLEPGDSWTVPREAPHTYRIVERFTAIEATSPPTE